MTRPAPHTAPPQRAFPDSLDDPADPRLRHRIQQWDGNAADVVLVGVPFDHGVALNGGRIGAADGPAAFRTAVERFGTTYDVEHRIDFDSLTIADAGDVEVVERDVRVTHDRHTETCNAILGAGAIPVVIGGGNDLSFASIRSLRHCAVLEDDHSVIGGINIDAHFDVREVVDGKVHSGTPYRRVLEELRVKGSHFVEFGCHASVNSRAHHDWLREQEVAVHPLAELRKTSARGVMHGELERLAAACTHLFVSIDLDAFAAPHAPGVSAPGTDGLTPDEGRELAFAAGAHPKVQLFELMEFNPTYDIDSRTGRLAVMLFCAFLAGVASRPAE